MKVDTERCGCCSPAKAVSVWLQMRDHKAGFGLTDYQNLQEDVGAASEWWCLQVRWLSVEAYMHLAVTG